MKKYTTVKTHTFDGIKYGISKCERIDGVTDMPGEPEELEMLILEGNNFRAFHSALHEGMEALGMCDKCVHGYRDDGTPRTTDLARFLWRLGYRRIRTKK